LTVPIHFELDRGKELGNPLYFIKHDRAFHAGEESLGIASGGGEHARIIEGEVPGGMTVRDEPFRQSALSCLASTVQENDGAVLEGIEDASGDISVNHVLHINQMPVNFQP
jgi:hypothetical protein